MTLTFKLDLHKGSKVQKVRFSTTTRT